jgi:cytochrome c
MAYAGLSDAKLRADVIDYLRTLAKSPEPLPASGPSAIKPAAASKPAADVPKVSGSSGGANAPAGQATQAGPNQNQPTDAQSQQQPPPQAHKVEPAAPGAPGAQGKPN